MKNKYPILLVHGLMLKDILFFKAFGKIPKVLRKEGFNIYCSTNDAVGTIENNAEQLKLQIKEILQREKVDKINIIAHSKGGLDIKYMIEKLNIQNEIASFTTICTPHKGSQIATKIVEKPKWILKIIAFFINLFYKILGDKKPNVLKVGEQLKANAIVNNHDMGVYNKIYCQSYSATLKHSMDDVLMTIPHIVLKKYDDGKSDGMVSNESAKFAKYNGSCVDSSISHTAIVDLMASRKDKKKIYDFYINVCNDLSKRGF